MKCYVCKILSGANSVSLIIKTASFKSSPYQVFLKMDVPAKKRNNKY